MPVCIQCHPGNGNAPLLAPNALQVPRVRLVVHQRHQRIPCLLGGHPLPMATVGPDGADYANESMFVDIVPDTLVRIRHLNLPHFELTITLTPVDAGTALSWVGVFENAAFAENARAFLETANEQNLDRLEAEVAR